jgi:hypothetical protein
MRVTEEKREVPNAFFMVESFRVRKTNKKTLGTA